MCICVIEYWFVGDCEYTMVRAGLIGSLLLFAACGIDALKSFPPAPAQPDIYTTPTQYMFGELLEGDRSEPVAIMVGNAGLGDLAVSSVTISGDNAGSFFIAEDALTGATITAGAQELTITVGFNPDGPGTRQAWLEIASNDPDENPAKIALHGLGAIDAAGPVAVCNATPTSPIATINAVTWSGSDSFDPDGFALVGYRWRIIEKPEQSWTPMPNCATQPECGPFLPDVQGSYTAELVVQNEIGLTDTCTVTFNASSAGDGPVAVCGVTPSLVRPPFETATWIGNNSYDPDGFAITRYSWRLSSSPAGSAVTMPTCSTANCGSFAPDITGTYVGELTVENAVGHTGTCSVELVAEPIESLWIEMYWQHSGDDMDLHLLSPGGLPNTSGDCYYANCVGRSPNWGAAGVNDDPSLDLDNIPGTGPENINISAPAPGTYKVFVYDHPNRTYQSGNAVTVNVYVDGASVFSETRTISGERTSEYFCTIDWPSGIATPL